MRRLFLSRNIEGAAARGVGFSGSYRLHAPFGHASVQVGVEGVCAVCSTLGPPAPHHTSYPPYIIPTIHHTHHTSYVGEAGRGAGKVAMGRGGGGGVSVPCAGRHHLVRAQEARLVQDPQFGFQVDDTHERYVDFAQSAAYPNATYLVSQNIELLSRRGCSVSANASGVDTHHDSISSRCECRHPRCWLHPRCSAFRFVLGSGPRALFSCSESGAVTEIPLRFCSVHVRAFA
jgi:hypothetical protein